MSMFENFPYTNLHELNLQWLIEEVKKCYSPDNPPEAMVISVNGESGIVTLYRDARISFPDVDAVQWNMYRGTDGKITGIEFNKDAPATRINGIQRFVIYDAGNPPPYPVVSVNGQTGAIILYSEAYVEFPDLDGDNWGIQRKLNADTENETIVGLMLNDDGDLSITKDEDTIPVYTSDNPPPYPVRSVDGMTGNVNTWGHTANSKIDIPIPARGDDWSIGRVIDQGGNLSIKIMYDDNIQKCTAYMIYDDGVNTPTPVKLLTLDDIPSSSGVISVNGNTGVVVLTGADIKINSNSNDSIETVIQNTINNIINLIAYKETEAVATRNYIKGQYIVIGSTLYKAKSNISATTAINTSNTDIVDNIGNDIKTIFESIANIPDVVNNLTTTTTGKALDARQGKQLNDIKATIKEGAIPANSFVSVDVSDLKICLIVVGRGSVSTTATCALHDQWGDISNITTNANYVINSSGDVVNITNNAGSYVDYLIIGHNA